MFYKLVAYRCEGRITYLLGHFFQRLHPSKIMINVTKYIVVLSLLSGLYFYFSKEIWYSILFNNKLLSYTRVGSKL